MATKLIRIFLPSLFLFSGFNLFAQDNSPYSRYGLGDLHPQSNTTTRGMGGISAGVAEWFSVNFTNPASYASFNTKQERSSNKLTWGRVILDVGTNLDNRTLIQPNTTNKFSSSDAFFSYVHLGLPITKNWGMSFGIRPLTRTSYRIQRSEYLLDPVTNDSIDLALTRFTGSGGSYLPSIGTGYAIKNFSAGINLGYLFGNKETSTHRGFLNDTVHYYASDHTTRSSFGGVFLNAGIQYKIDLRNERYIRLGASGNWEQKLSGSRDILRQTFTTGASGEIIQIDSVFEEKNIQGDVVYPASIKAGFVVGKDNDLQGWLFGADYTTTKWSDSRFFGIRDSVQDNWQVNAGAQFRPRPRVNYFSQVAYRFGFFAGQDYVRVTQKLPVYGASVGLGLPIKSNTRAAATQYSLLNLGLEYIKRGNNDNLLKENLFRISLGFNFTDLWFAKRKYD